MLQSSAPKLLIGTECARDAVKSIDKASVRIALVTTTFRADDQLSSDIIDALCRASKRGVIVSVCADTYTYLEPRGFNFTSTKQYSARAYHALKLERKLKSSGVSFHWLGRLSNFGFTGRTHSKWLVADDIVYCFGGVNFDGESFTHNDYLFRLKNNDFADQMFAQHTHTIKADKSGHAARYYTVPLDKNSTALFDRGLIGNSIIYRRACELAQEATDITLVSQYCPTGKLSRILHRKHAKLYFNHWHNTKGVNTAMIRFGMTLTHQHTLYKRDQYLHAKFILFTMPNGSKIAITGSHNFMFGSVVFGTREVALETSDTAIIAQLEKFFKNHVE